ncbi:hypothetical protein [Fibrella forsythiae]|uniref:DUF2780 domain-containing protein n=1 Tax=Fibrella forsythiae TaxID=2817061 RepID=A0ABS3JSH4_9BACT|nr:hypothetical protein [Fibrella forsythiae]MBO0951842.1 hypothetical protein [Fibrella forsythiae]
MMTHNLFRRPKLTLACLLLSTASAVAQLGTLPKAVPATATPAPAVPSAADSVAHKLDQAVIASTNGDKTAAVTGLNEGVAAAEAQAAISKGDFKEKLMSQTGALKQLIPGVASGAVSGNMLAKAVSLVKMALGANQISSLLGGGGSLLSSAGALTGGLNLLKGGLPSLGGQAASTGGSLISTALSGVSKLGGLGGAAAEPAVKQQLGGVLNFAKGIL